MRRCLLALSLVFAVGCGGSGASGDEPPADDAGPLVDGAAGEAGAGDGASSDAMGEASAGGSDAQPDAAPKDAGPIAPTTALLRPDKPMPCADPAVVSLNGAGKVFYVYCTSMSHVWRTTDWVSFTDVRSSVSFALAGMADNGKLLGSWWAPGLVYSKALDQYVMWVSVPDAQGTNTPSDGWDTRSLAVLTAPAPDGPWTYRALAIDAKVSEHFIDPFLFLDADGVGYAYWKQYGGGLSSSIMGARLTANLSGLVSGTSMEVMNGFGGPGTWEDNVRENPAVVRDSAGRHHLIFSGGHWFNDTYATAHALSTCGPLCPAATAGGWRMVDSGDRGVLQVVRSVGNPSFANGGPGGAVFLDDAADRIVYAAAAKSATGDKTRYLMLDAVAWQNRAPFVDTKGHEPLGF